MMIFAFAELGESWSQDLFGGASVAVYNEKIDVAGSSWSVARNVVNATGRSERIGNAGFNS